MPKLQPVSLPDQFQFHGHVFPLVLELERAEASPTEVRSAIAQQRAELLRLAAVHGAVLFRGLPLQDAEDLDAFIQAFDLPNFPYDQSLSNAVRVNRTPRVFTANEAPASVTIFLHHEMAQTPIYPSHLFFFCEQAAEAGGATPICRSDILWERLSRLEPRFAADCETKGLRYTNVMPSADDRQSGMGRSWQSTLRAATRQEAEDRLRRYGYQWEWLEDDCLRATTPRLPAIRCLADGRVTFFNQLIAAFQGWKDARNDPSRAITFGDGTPLDPSAARSAARLAEELSFDIAWHNGDVALVDNFVTMHGRRTFRGTRRVLASLALATDPTPNRNCLSSLPLQPPIPP
jgi:alpha-ketoglutarate-dependent taurine dioxygenase